MKAAYGPEDHTFVICAFGESPYLGACIRSLLRQSIRSGICMVTSTPNEQIRRAAEQYHIPLYINTGESGIAGDWNFGVQTASSSLVTLAHQDDLYGRTYTEEILAAANECCYPLILFSDYCELRKAGSEEADAGEKQSTGPAAEQKGGRQDFSADRGWQIVTSNRLLRIKRLLLLPLTVKRLWSSVSARRRMMSLGSAICCPAVTMVKENLELPVFENNMKSNIDWQAWEKISVKKGEFAYIPRPLMLHRIHAESATSSLLRENGRAREDMVMYRKFWPEPAARMIEHFYRAAEKSNQT